MKTMEIKKLNGTGMEAFGADGAEDQQIVENVSTPSIMFFYGGTGKLGKEVAKKLKERGIEVEDGDPFFFEGDDPHLLGEETLYMVLPNSVYQYWAQRKESDLSLVRTSRTRRTGGKSGGLTSWQENVLATVIILNPPFEEALPIVSVTNFRGAKTNFPKQMRKAILETKEKEWAKEDKLHAALIKAGVPEAFRITSEMNMTSHTAGSGFAYTKASADPRASGESELAVINDWLSTVEAKSATEAAADKLAKLRAEVEEKITS